MKRRSKYRIAGAILVVVGAVLIYLQHRGYLQLGAGGGVLAFIGALAMLPKIPNVYED